MTRISDGNVFSYIPRLIGVYPVISDNQKFTKRWSNYGSIKQQQVANVSLCIDILKFVWNHAHCKYISIEYQVAT